MQMTQRKLSPRDAVERWLDSIRPDRSDQTVSTYWYRLKLFVEWCEQEHVESISDLDGWLIDSYKTYRRGVNPSQSTLKNEFSTLKNFLEYCARIELVDESLPEKVEVPSVSKQDRSSDIILEPADATALLTYYRNSDGQYGTRGHALLELTWHTGARVGGIQSLDLDDEDAKAGTRYLLFKNRPEEDTRLKKGYAGERAIGLPESVWGVLDHYKRHYRIDITDDYGRKPLITSTHGRPTKGTLRNWMYEATIPCHHTDCPHGKRRATCEWTDYNHASNCPSSRSPHQVRSGAITWMLNKGMPIGKVADKVNATEDMIREHYDKPDPVDELLERRIEFSEQLDIGNQEDGYNDK